MCPLLSAGTQTFLPEGPESSVALTFYSWSFVVIFCVGHTPPCPTASGAAAPQLSLAVGALCPCCPPALFSRAGVVRPSGPSVCPRGSIPLGSGCFRISRARSCGVGGVGVSARLFCPSAQSPCWFPCPAKGCPPGPSGPPWASCSGWGQRVLWAVPWSEVALVPRLGWCSWRGTEGRAGRALTRLPACPPRTG